ncbi:MAG: hypothetical protein JJU34_10160 [Lunatimonas sp.]|uniref:hypothetical protein n=1 Tax=Lunatimonas sp. TaxID=2060141 RepID=UPI00263A7C1F|nr:hypothetical protein [Lunatimonas sp.]MCC5937636.1 hypothetical protein [Lunatimonas sp.]
MKKLYFTFVLAVLWIFSIQAQTYYVINPTPVFTPKSSPIEVAALYSADFNITQKNTIRQDYEDAYDDIVVLGEATRTYNCHNFAWHIADGGTATAWMNQIDITNGPNVAKYWTDGSFIEVCNESESSKIFYFTGDHSAIMSTISGYYDSKWGPDILVRHAPTNLPGIYVPADRRYFASILLR